MLDRDRLALASFEKRFDGRLSNVIIRNRGMQPNRI